MEERRRFLEEARMREVQPKLSGKAHNQHLPAHLTDPHAARRASGAAASSSTSSSGSVQQSNSARGAQKPALRNGRPGVRLPPSRAAQGATSPAVPKPDVEKMRGQPGVIFYQEQDPHSDEFVPPVTVPFGGVYNPRTPAEMGFSSPTGGAGCQQAVQDTRSVQKELSEVELHHSYVGDIMPEEHPAAERGQEGSQEGSSAIRGSAAMQKDSSGGSRGAAVGGAASGGAASGAPVMGSGIATGVRQPADKSFGASLTSFQGRNKRSVTASAASSDTSQVCPRACLPAPFCFWRHTHDSAWILIGTCSVEDIWNRSANLLCCVLCRRYSTSVQWMLKRITWIVQRRG